MKNNTVDVLWRIRTSLRSAFVKLQQQEKKPCERTEGMKFAAEEFDKLLKREIAKADDSAIPYATDEEIVEFLDGWLRRGIESGTYVLNPKLADYDPEYAKQLKAAVLKEFERITYTLKKRREGSILAAEMIKQIWEDRK